MSHKTPRCLLLALSRRTFVSQYSFDLGVNMVQCEVFNLLRRSYRITQLDIEQALADVGLDGNQHIIAHTSMRAFGYIDGGAATVGRALKSRAATLIAPAFSYYTLVWPTGQRQPDWPEILPPNSGRFDRFSKVSSDIGRVPQYLIEDHRHERSMHPALSFVGYGRAAHSILNSQTLDSPYAPVGELADMNGYVLLMGVDHRSNTSVHYGEYLAGQVMLPRYVRINGVVKQTYFPNCSAAFDKIEPHLRVHRSTQLEKGTIGLFSVQEILDVTMRMLKTDPESLLCRYTGCRCQHVRQLIRAHGLLQPRTRYSKSYFK